MDGQGNMALSTVRTRPVGGQSAQRTRDAGRAAPASRPSRIWMGIFRVGSVARALPLSNVCYALETIYL